MSDNPFMRTSLKDWYRIQIYRGQDDEKDECDLTRPAATFSFARICDDERDLALDEDAAKQSILH
jgi:hypothetical protein